MIKYGSTLSGVDKSYSPGFGGYLKKETKKELTREENMVPDWEVNTVYVSDLLSHQYPEVADAIKGIFKENQIPCRTLRDTKDIWCRDYMPIQVDKDQYLQFKYTPDYLKGFESKVTPPLTECPRDVLIIDGGNVVSSSTTVVMTDKIFRENPRVDRARLRSRLETIFRARLIVVPKQPYDYVGHSDGIVRFLDDRRVLVNDYTREDKAYGERLQTCLRRHGLIVEKFPYHYTKPPKGKKDIDTAVGVYLNYLRVGNVVILPAFGLTKDEHAKQTMAQLLPGAKLYQVPAAKLATAGGVFNCVTCTYKEDSGVSPIAKACRCREGTTKYSTN